MSKITDTDLRLYKGFINAYLKSKDKQIVVKNSDNVYSINLQNKNTGEINTIAKSLKKKEAYNLLVFGTNMIYESKH